MSDRVELQLEVDAPRSAVYELMSTSAGLSRWLDGADIEPRVGAPVRLRLRDATAVGEVLAVDRPQHISFTFDWADEPLPRPSVVALDAIDHGARTHVTLRQVGLRPGRQVELHAEVWRYWLGRFAAAARGLPDKVETTHP